MKKTPSNSIYIIEDDQTIVSLLKQHLSKNYRVTSVMNFRSILHEVRECQPDVILMDITLPYFNGFYWTTEIRKTLMIPIIFISSATDEMDAIMAMNMGADDFITKPFSLPILDAKISAFLRRANHFDKKKWEFQQFHLNPDGQLYNQQTQESCQLSPTESKILMLLFERQGEVVSKDDILDRLWDGEDFIDQNTLNVNMTRLRKRVQSIGFTAICTVRGVGYIIND